MEEDGTYELLIDVVPFLEKGRRFYMEIKTGHVYGIEDGRNMEYPLRSALSNYLWLLRSCDKYMKRVR